MKLIDLAGNTFGRWAVISRSANIGRVPAWLCRCECGEERVVRGGDLRDGKSRSCGCLQSDVVSSLCLEDLTGRRFGRLSVVRRIDGADRVMWLCQCECGDTSSVQSSNLKSGATKSCGCLNVDVLKGRHTNKEFSNRIKQGVRDYFEYEAAMKRLEKEEIEHQQNHHQETEDE